MPTASPLPCPQINTSNDLAIKLTVEITPGNETVRCNFKIPVTALRCDQEAAGAFVGAAVMSIKKEVEAEKRARIAKIAAAIKERTLKRKREEEAREAAKAATSNRSKASSCDSKQVIHVAPAEGWAYLEQVCKFARK